MSSRASRLRGRWQGLGQGHLSKLSPQVLRAVVTCTPGLCLSLCSVLSQSPSSCLAFLWSGAFQTLPSISQATPSFLPGPSPGFLTFLSKLCLDHLKLCWSLLCVISRVLFHPSPNLSPWKPGSISVLNRVRTAQFNTKQSSEIAPFFPTSHPLFSNSYPLLPIFQVSPRNLPFLLPSLTTSCSLAGQFCGSFH